MKNGGLAKVVRDGEQEGLVAGKLCDGALRVVVELVVPCELGQERLEPPLLREVGHAKEERPRVLVLRDRLEPLDVLLPETEHLKDNARPLPMGTA